VRGYDVAVAPSIETNRKPVITSLLIHAGLRALTVGEFFYVFSPRTCNPKCDAERRARRRSRPRWR
jgi:hypothetical protein